MIEEVLFNSLAQYGGLGIAFYVLFHNYKDMKQILEKNTQALVDLRLAIVKLKS